MCNRTIEIGSKGIARAFRGASLTVTVAALLLVMASADVRTVSAQNQFAAAGSGGFFPYDGFGGWGTPGTAESAAEYGMASVIAASGYAHLQNSLAARNYMAAHSQNFDNRLQWTRAYYDMRREHRAYVADHTRLSMDQITKIANDAAPKPLDATQLDPTTGKIAWPIILRDPRYVGLTDELENLFKARATISDFAGAENYRSINRTCEDLLNLLKANLDEYRPNDFIQARHLVRSLRYKARLPVSNRIDTRSVAKL